MEKEQTDLARIFIGRLLMLLVFPGVWHLSADLVSRDDSEDSVLFVIGSSILGYACFYFFMHLSQPGGGRDSTRRE